MLASSPLFSALDRLSRLNGDFYFYEPLARCINSGSGAPLEWRAEHPDSSETICLSRLDTYSGALCRTLGSAPTKLSPEEATALICEKKLWGGVSILWLSGHCISGDYCGATYTLSNAQALLEEFGGRQVRECYGGHGSYGIAVDPRYVTEELLEALESLESYPVHDEDHLCHLEESLKEEAFSSYVEHDLRQHVCKVLSAFFLDNGKEEEAAEEEADRLSEEATEEILWQILRDADDNGCLWTSEHNSMYCDIDRIADAAILEAMGLS